MFPFGWIGGIGDAAGEAAGDAAGGLLSPLGNWIMQMFIIGLVGLLVVGWAT